MHSRVHVTDGSVDPAMDDLLLQGPEEALGDAVCFRLTDEGVALGHASEPDPVLEVLGH
ncbi:MAG: hypothetical protein ACREFP_11850 [Acetobacteraceae bacterium]